MQKLIGITILFTMLTSLTPIKKTHVIFFGDSITQAAVAKGGYIWRIQQALEAQGKADQYILTGAGIGGNKVYDLYLRLEEDVLAKKPDEVVIYIGVNDVWHKTTHGTGTDLDKFEKFYHALIRKMQQQQIRVVVATPAGIGELRNNANPQDADLNRYSDVIRKLAAQYQLPLVDLRKQWQEYNEQHNMANAPKGILSTDGVHLNDAGNQWVADAMMQALGMR
jgi:lysophospholipase L1-like esterase